MMRIDMQLMQKCGPNLVFTHYLQLSFSFFYEKLDILGFGDKSFAALEMSMKEQIISQHSKKIILE